MTTVTTGLDTSVVVRLLVGAPAEEAARALASVRSAHRRGERLIVADLVVAEAYFALQHHYGVPKREACARLLEMLASRLVAPEPGGLAPEALARQTPAGLVDRMIVGGYRRHGATTLTLDQRMADPEGAELL